MALSEGNVILASDFIAIKARVKAECARRKYNGSVESYAGSSYDYTVTPADDNVPLPEHFNKIIVPMNAMVNTGRSQTQNGYLVRAMNDIDSALTTLESIAETASSSGCKSSCTGLCQGTCTTGCSGCTGGCSGECGANCSVGCKTACGTSCQKACSTCSTSCGTECDKNCNNSCSGSCKGGCYVLCSGNCKGVNEYNPVQ